MTTAEVPTPTPASRRPSALVARLLDITQGQASTMFIALGLAVVLTLGGLPPVLRNRSNGEAAEVASITAPESTPSATDESAGADPAPPDPGAADPEFGSPAPAPAPAGSPDLGGSDSGSFSDDFSGGSDSFSSPAEDRGPATGEAEVFTPVSGAAAPDGIAVDDEGTVYVASGGEVLSYDEDGAAGRRFTVRGDDVRLTGLALDGDGGLVALDAGTGRVQRINLANGRQRTLATLIDVPACQLVVAAVNGCEAGVSDDAPLPRDAAFDTAGNLYVTDAAQGTIWRVPAGGGDPELFTTDAAFGSGDGLAGITVQGNRVVVASPQAVDPEAAGGGAVYAIAVGADGRAGERTLLARFLPAERPAGVTALPDGSLVVALQEANAIVLVDRDGAEVRRVEGSAGDTPIEAPTGVAFHGQTLLVTNQAADRANWAVLAVGIR